MYQPVYGYGQQQSQSQPSKQPNYQYTQQGDTNYSTSQQQTYPPGDGRTNLPNFNSYIAQQTANNTTNSPAVTSTNSKVNNNAIIDKDNNKQSKSSPQLSNKLKDPSLLQQQQQQQKQQQQQQHQQQQQQQHQQQQQQQQQQHQQQQQQKQQQQQQQQQQAQQQQQQQQKQQQQQAQQQAQQHHQQQQQYNYNPIRQSPINTNSELLKSNNFPSRSYRSPITSPTQGYTNGFNSQDIVAGLTQPNYNPNSVHNNSGNELPTLPPLNVSSPQLNTNRQRWTPDEEKLARSVSSTQPDPSVLIQYHNVPNTRDDRRLMSPYPQQMHHQQQVQQQRQHQQQQRQQVHQQVQHQQVQQQEIFGNNGEMGPYGCGVMNCFASFSASNGLFYHMKNVHPNIEEIYKPYRCAMPTCPKRYKNINGLQYHLREAKGSSGHGGLSGQDGEQLNVKPYTCQIPGCKKAYRTANGLRYHQVHGHNIQPHPLMENNIQGMMLQSRQPQIQQQQQQQQQQQSLPQFRMQREKWLMNNNI